MAYDSNKKSTDLEAKTTPVDADVAILGDSADSGRAKKLTWANIKATLKTYFDTIYTLANLGGLASSSKATQAEVATGTDDTKYTTPLAVAPYGNQSLFRQAIINGNFDVWQRGTSFTVTTGTGAYTADRFYTFNLYGNNDYVLSQLAITDLPGSIYALQTSWSANPSDQGRQRIQYTLENATARTLAGKVCTLSFQVKSKAGMTSVNTFAKYNTAGTKIAYNDTEITSNSTNINTSTWTKVSLTFTVPALATLTATGVFGFDIAPAKTTNESTGDGIQIAQVQLCAGSVALPFQPKSFAEELRDCQRYYEKSYNHDVELGTSTTVGCIYWKTWATTNFSQIPITYSIRKRTTPTIVVYSTTGASGKFRNVSAETDIDGQGSNIGVRGCSMLVANVSVTADQDVACHYTASAEL